MSIKDRIYKINIKNNRLESRKNILIGELLYEGDLNLDALHPIETLSVVENEDVKKVYWADGKNQPRVININETTEIPYDNNSFDFIQNVNLEGGNAIVTKTELGGGIFPAGVIQYALTYFNDYKQESNIFYISPLLYSTHSNRGADADDKISNSFNIVVIKPDIRFKYVRIYSIMRTSIDATPLVKRVIDLPITYTKGGGEIIGTMPIDFTDNNTLGNIVDPIELLYVGGEPLIASTLAAKDNTLFLGNIKLPRKPAGNILLSNGGTIQNEVLYSQVSFGTRKINTETNWGTYYGYKPNLLGSSSSMKSFKKNEWYRFGVSFQHVSGKWSEPIFLNDAKNNSNVSLTTFNSTNKITTINGCIARVRINNNNNLTQELINNGYIAAKGVVVYPSINDKSVICQGIANSTLFNVSDRYTNSPFAISSWYFRPLRSGATISTNNKLKGSVTTFQHLYGLPPSRFSNCEIQTTADNPNPYDITISKDKFVDQNSHLFYVDQSIITLHSPDIEFDDTIKNLNMDGLKLRIVAFAALTGFSSNYDLTTSTGPLSITAPGFLKVGISSPNCDNVYGANALISVPAWIDGISTSDNNPKAFPLFPWQANRPLNLTSSSDTVKTAIIAQKKMSNFKYSAYNLYISTAEQEAKGIFTLDDVKIASSTETDIIKLDYKKRTSENPGQVTYAYNIDKVINFSKTKDVNGYPITILKGYSVSNGIVESINNDYEETSTKVLDPVRIRYKSTPHAVVRLGTGDSINTYNILPATDEANQSLLARYNTKIIPYWGEYQFVKQDIITLSDSYASGLWLVELYREDDTIINRFGGESAAAFEANEWVTGGPTTILDPNQSYINLNFTEGDTYVQRYDCLKTYAYSNDDVQTLSDTLSFICETRVNLDMRYDRNRGNTNSLVSSPLNTNLINPVYNQKNNFFTYRAIDYSKTKLDNFPSTVTWTRTKVFGELVDTWTNTTMASIIDVNTSLGSISSLKLFNNKIYGFQDSGIFNILSNSRVQVNPSDNIPIEIASSNKVEGVRYISQNVGVSNKWSIVQGSSSLYFIDDLTKSIFSIKDDLIDISSKCGMSSFMKTSINSSLSWDPYTFNNFIASYDSIYNDVYFTNKYYCFNYNEKFDSFISFFNYERTPYMFNIWNGFMAIGQTKRGTASDNPYYLWNQNSGSYNEYFNVARPSYTTLIVNKDITLNKTFNNIEFRSDSFTNVDSDKWNITPTTSFNKIEAWDEYQYAYNDLKVNINLPSNLKQKFRVWRINMPRFIDTTKKVGILNSSKLTNSWIYLKLSTDSNSRLKTVLHDVIVNYSY